MQALTHMLHCPIRGGSTRSRGAVLEHNVFKDDGEVKRLMLVQSCPTVLIGLRALLQSFEKLEVVGEATDPEDALTFAEKRPPDLVLTDFGPEERPDAIYVCQKLKSLPRPPQVVFYTHCCSAVELAEILLCGADGYIHTSLQEGRLRKMLHKLCAGEPVWHWSREQRDDAQRLVDLIRVSRLTRRERDVLGLLLRRHSNREISKELRLAPQTVKNYVAAVLRKLGYSRRADLHRDWNR